MWNAVGGSTNVYTALWPRYRPSDFRKGVEHGLAPDWPITYEDLAPYYDRVDRIVGVSGLAGNPAMPPHEAYPTPPLPLRPVGRRLAQGVRPARLALVADPGGRRLRGLRRPPRLQRLLGLRGRLRARLDEQVLALGLAEGARGGRRPAPASPGSSGSSAARTGASPARSMSTAAPASRHFQAADVVVLACNGVGTPRLLLMSDNLANGSDQVGRNLMHHTLVACEMWVEEPLHSHMGFIGALISMEFAETDTARGFVNGFNFNCATAGHAGGQSIGFVTPASAPWGKGHHDWFRRHFGHGCAVFAIGDDLPQASNRVTLSETEKDADGLPAPKITYAPHENDLRMMRFALQRLEDIAQAADAFDYRLHDYMSADGVYQTPAWHLLGTCRMGARSRDLGDQQVAPGLGRPQSLHRRRQRADHGRRGQPDQHDLRACPARRRASARQFRRPAARREAACELIATRGTSCRHRSTCWRASVSRTCRCRSTRRRASLRPFTARRSGSKRDDMTGLRLSPLRRQQAPPA